MCKTSLFSLLRKRRRLFTSSNVSVPSCFLLKAKTPPSYFALKVCGAGAGFGAEAAVVAAAGCCDELSIVRGLCAAAEPATSATSRPAPVNIFALFITFSLTVESDAFQRGRLLGLNCRMLLDRGRPLS